MCRLGRARARAAVNLASGERRAARARRGVAQRGAEAASSRGRRRGVVGSRRPRASSARRIPRSDRARRVHRHVPVLRRRCRDLRRSRRLGIARARLRGLLQSVAHASPHRSRRRPFRHRDASRRFGLSRGRRSERARAIDRERVSGGALRNLPPRTHRALGARLGLRAMRPRGLRCALRQVSAAAGGALRRVRGARRILTLRASLDA